MNDEPIDRIKLLQMLFGEENDGNKIRNGATLVGALYDNVFEAMKWCEELPYMQFPAHWQVKITPPFVSSIIRFRVKRETTPPNDNVSVYFDGYNNLGHCSGPYWEIYPDCEGDTDRFLLGEEKEMFEKIELALDRLEEPKNDKS